MQTKIHKNTFKGCTSLTRISLPTSILSIDDCAFKDCTALQKVDLGEQVKFIGTSAFCGDVSLVDVDRFNDPNSSHTFDIVGNYAFANTGLTAANLALRSSAIQTFWGDGCFQDCTSLKNVHVLSANYMSRNMFKGCTSLTSIQYDVGMMAYTYPGIFDGCTNLQSIKLPAELLFIPEGAFKGCSKLTSMQFTSYAEKSAIDEIQKDAFNGCSKLTTLEIPESINSIDELDIECFNNMPSLQTLKFHGIGSDQLSVRSYDIPSENWDIKLNTWTIFKEPYYALYPSYSKYASSGIDSADDGLISEDEYNEQTISCDANYKTLSSIISAALVQNVPIILAIGIKYLETNSGGFICTPNDLITKGLDEYFDSATFHLGSICPSFLLSVQIGSKKFNCQYLKDNILKDAFIWPDIYLDPSWYDGSDPLNSLDPSIYTYAQSYLTKKQLSAVFIGYIIDIGEFDLNIDYDPLEKPNVYIPKLKTAISNRLTKFTGGLTGTLKNSLFKSINQNFFSTKSGVAAALKTYSNYGMICTKFGTSIKKYQSIQLPTEISSDEAYQELATKELTDIENYKYRYEENYYNTHGVQPELPNYDGIVMDGSDEFFLTLNNACVSVLNKLVDNKKYSVLSLDYDFTLPSEQLVSNVSFIKKCNMVDEVTFSGFFGLQHNAKIWCHDMPNNTYFQYKYEEQYYEEPERISYESDSTTTKGFQFGKWYYNSRDVYAEARRKGLPCLFIYSLWGCGPCGIYQKNLWNNVDFQEWFAKQKFLLCGLECQQQPMYDVHLQFLTDELSLSALNFAKEDQGESLASKTPNAFGQKFKRYKVGQSFASTLMTPVLIFMDKDGNCYDYTYHNIGRSIKNFNVSGMLQQLKSLCLYHFDNNSLENPQYVVEANKTFNASDYYETLENPWQIATNVINMSINVPEFEYKACMTIAQLEQYMINELKQMGQNHGGIYLAGCLLVSFYWITATFGYDIETYTTADQLNNTFKQWYLKVGEFYYQMVFDKNDKILIPNPCMADGSKEYIYKVSFVQKEYHS